jgi:hypothetical protein
VTERLVRQQDRVFPEQCGHGGGKKSVSRRISIGSRNATAACVSAYLTSAIRDKGGYPEYGSHCCKQQGLFDP